MSNDQMTKCNLALTHQQVKELNAIEKDTDRPRTRIIRRAIEEYLKRYRTTNPEFDARFPRNESEPVDRDFRPGIQTDVVVIRGVKTEVVITPDGMWRKPVESDYVSETEEKSVGSSILDTKN